MAVRRRRPVSKAAAAPTSRVHAITTLEQFQTMVGKAAAANKVFAVQFYQADNYVSTQMRSFYRRMSVDPTLKAAVFAEVEVDSSEEELLDECGLLTGGKIPCYRCYVGGQEVANYAGGTPAEVAKMIAAQLSLVKRKGGGLFTKLLLGAAAVAAAAGAAYWHLNRQPGSGSKGADAGALAEEMRSLSERIGIAQQRLSNAERAGRLKSAKNQRTLLQQLRSRQRSLEQQLDKRQQPTSGSGKGKGKGAAEAQSDAEEGSEGEARRGGGGRQGRRERRQVVPADLSDDEEWIAALTAPKPTVLYSDEE